MKRLPCEIFIMLTALCVLLAAPAAQAEYITGFEGLLGSADGVLLTGQDGYYIPAGTTSTDFLVFTYTGNAFGLPQNPTGAAQFVGGHGPGGSTFARAQRDLSFADSDVWLLAYDFAATYLGIGASANNVGSFSMRNNAANVNHFIHLASWVDANNPTNYNAFYLAYDAGGVQFPQPGTSPGPAWENLELNHWYRAWVRVDFVSNRFLELGIVDLETMAEAVFAPADWYLEGGSGGTTAIPDCFRFFAGGSVVGNCFAFDNIAIELQITATVNTSWGGLKALY